MSERRRGERPPKTTEVLGEVEKRELGEKGWTRLFGSQGETPETPKGLQGIPIEGVIVGERDLLVYDPSQADLRETKTLDKNAPSKQEMLATGWTLIDGNIARLLWIRKRQDTKSTVH